MNIPAHAYPADIKPLTTLRFFAAFIVVIHHFIYFSPWPLNAVSMIPAKGYLAVDFFFILSGFILTHAYRTALMAGTITPLQFYLRRLARIYPLHLCTLFIAALLSLTAVRFGPAGRWPGEFPLGSFADHVVMMHGWGFESGLRFNIPSWSISAEWFAYLLFPFLAVSMLRSRADVILIACVFLYFWAWIAAAMIEPLRPLTRYSYDFSILRIMPAFALGIALYMFFSARAPFVQASKALYSCFAAVILLLHFGAPDIFAIALFATIIIFAADLSRLQGAGRWLSSRTGVWLGEISYAVYMVHYLVMTALLSGFLLYQGHEPYTRLFPVLAILSIAVTILAAALLYHALEKPARRWITRAAAQS